MASVFGHGIVGYTVYKLSTKNNQILLILAIISSVLPDIDVLGFNLGITYGEPLGHRGFTHSIVFALLWSLLVMFFFGKKYKLLFFLVVFLTTISHGILDALTTGGYGVGFFIPFNNERFFFPNTFITVSPLGVERFFSNWGLRVLVDEMKYILIPCALILTLKYVLSFIGKKD